MSKFDKDFEALECMREDDYEAYKAYIVSLFAIMWKIRNMKTSGDGK